MNWDLKNKHELLGEWVGEFSRQRCQHKGLEIEKHGLLKKKDFSIKNSVQVNSDHHVCEKWQILDMGHKKILALNMGN